MWGGFWLLPGSVPYFESVSVSDQILDANLEPGVSVRQALRLILSESAGDLTISGTTYTIKNIDGSVNRIVATVDAAGRDVTALNTS